MRPIVQYGGLGLGVGGLLALAMKWDVFFGELRNFDVGTYWFFLGHTLFLALLLVSASAHSFRYSDKGRNEMHQSLHPSQPESSASLREDGPSIHIEKGRRVRKCQLSHDCNTV